MLGNGIAFENLHQIQLDTNRSWFSEGTGDYENGLKNVKNYSKLSTAQTLFKAKDCHNIIFSRQKIFKIYNFTI